MSTKPTVGQKLSSVVVGIAILIPALFFMVMGVTFLPVIGLVMGLPIMALSIKFIMVSLKQEAESLQTATALSAPSIMIKPIASQSSLPLPKSGDAAESHPPTWKEAA